MGANVSLTTASATTGSCPRNRGSTGPIPGIRQKSWHFGGPEI